MNNSLLNFVKRSYYLLGREERDIPLERFIKKHLLFRKPDVDIKVEDVGEGKDTFYRLVISTKSGLKKFSYFAKEEDMKIAVLFHLASSYELSKLEVKKSIEEIEKRVGVADIIQYKSVDTSADGFFSFLIATVLHKDIQEALTALSSSKSKVDKKK